MDDKELGMNVFLRLNTDVLNYFLIYVRMLITLNLLFESESYDCHMIVRAKARLFKICRHLGFVLVSHGTTHEASFMVRTSYKNFVMIG